MKKYLVFMYRMIDQGDISRYIRNGAREQILDVINRYHEIEDGEDIVRKFTQALQSIDYNNEECIEIDEEIKISWLGLLVGSYRDETKICLTGLSHCIYLTDFSLGQYRKTYPEEVSDDLSKEIEKYQSYTISDINELESHISNSKHLPEYKKFKDKYPAGFFILMEDN